MMVGFAEYASTKLGGTSALRASSVLVNLAGGDCHDGDIATLVFSTQSLYTCIRDATTYTIPLSRMKMPGTQEPAESQLVCNVSAWSGSHKSGSEVPVEQDTHETQRNVHAHEKT